MLKKLFADSSSIHFVYVLVSRCSVATLAHSHADAHTCANVLRKHTSKQEEAQHQAHHVVRAPTPAVCVCPFAWLLLLLLFFFASIHISCAVCASSSDLRVRTKRTTSACNGISFIYICVYVLVCLCSGNDSAQLLLFFVFVTDPSKAQTTLSFPHPFDLSRLCRCLSSVCLLCTHTHIHKYTRFSSRGSTRCFVFALYSHYAQLMRA